MLIDHLFVYGTLLSTDNEFAKYLNNNATLVSKGFITGQLYDIGEYPGAVVNETEGYPIHGSVCKLNNANALVVLDNYEGYGADQDQPNLFIRDLLPVDTAEGEINCWVYLYNLSVDGLTEIKSGDYKSYLK